MALFIIELQSELPIDKRIAATSRRALTSFMDKMKQEQAQYSIGGENLLKFFENMLLVEEDKGLNALSDDESVIAVADKLHSTSITPP